MRKAGDTGDIVPSNFLDVIGFSAKFFGFSAKFRDFIRILKKPSPPHHSFFACMPEMLIKNLVLVSNPEILIKNLVLVSNLEIERDKILTSKRTAFHLLVFYARHMHW